MQRVNRKEPGMAYESRFSPVVKDAKGMITFGLESVKVSMTSRRYIQEVVEFRTFPTK